MNTFFTLTDRDTRYCNSRSERFDTFEQATRVAKARIALYAKEHGGQHPGVIIMKSVAFVEPVPPVAPNFQLTFL